MKFAFMNRLKALLNNQWFFPVLFIYYGVFYGLFNQKGDKIPIKLEYMELDELFMVWGCTEEIIQTG